MNLSLEVFKTDYAGDYSKGRHIRFAVVDLDNSKGYPANYICLLPANQSANGKADNNFSKLFGKESSELAKKLLTKALKTEEDAEVKGEIKRRLTMLKPKPPIQAKCRICGNSFETKRSRFKQKICQECKQKMYGKR